MSDISEVKARLDTDYERQRLAVPSSACTVVTSTDLRALLDAHARQAEMLEDYKRLLTVALNTKISGEEVEKLSKDLGL